MVEAIADTGPPLHLAEIGQLATLRLLPALLFPEGVRDELAARRVPLSLIEDLGVACRVVSVDPGIWQRIQSDAEPVRIQAADAQVFYLAQVGGFAHLVLSEDLALRGLLEERGATVVGSVGLLIRAFRQNLLGKAELERAMEDLGQSSLHLSKPFRSYLKNLLRELR